MFAGSSNNALAHFRVIGELIGGIQDGLFDTLSRARIVFGNPIFDVAKVLFSTFADQGLSHFSRLSSLVVLA